MFNARFVLALLILTGAALAACSGNFGAGTGAPGGLLPSGPLGGIAPTPTPTPNSASNILTYGDSAAFQPLPSAAGYGGAIAFEVPSPRPSGFQAIPIGATLAVVAPTDAPDLNLVTPGSKGKKRERPARPLVFVSLLATHDLTLTMSPRVAIDVPREIVTTYREDEINLAFYNSADKERVFKLAVAQHDTASPPPSPSPGITAPPPPTAIPVSAASAGSSPSPSPSASVPAGFPTGSLTPPPAVPGGAAPPPGAKPSPVVSPTLPPQRIVFAASVTTIKLIANKPAVFALYALPVATPSPSASGSAAEPEASGSPAAGKAAASKSPAAVGSPVAGGSPVATGSPVASGSPSALPATTASASAASAAASGTP